MEKFEEIEEKIKYYQENFRHPNLEKFKISGFYDLFPDSKTELKVEESWPNKWLFCGEAGVYIFLSDNLEVVYIGKANHFGERFSHYFGYGKDKKCSLKHSWNTKPRYVITIMVPRDSKFENSALEGFLLSKILTTDNTMENKG